MFGGIVETTGEIIALHMADACKHFTIAPRYKFTDLAIGDSIAINGVCLTVTHFDANTFAVTAVPETLRLTNLDFLTLNDQVNLERSLAVNGRIGGHSLQGHVDTVGEIIEIKHEGAALLVKISVPQQLTKYIVTKGYIAIDGMSITVIEVTDHWFTATFIPHTQMATIVKHYSLISKVNIEVDILGKYIEKLIGAYTHAL